MDRPLDFCMVTTFYPPYHFGGDAMYVYRLANALAKQGHSVTVVHNVDAYKVLRRGEPAGRFPHEPGVAVHPIRSRARSVSPLVTYLTGRPGLTGSQLRGIFDARSFDVVHFHNISLMGGPGVLAYGTGVKLYTMHEHWLVCPMHVLWKYNRRPCERPACLRCTTAFKRPPQLWRYTNLLENRLDDVDVFLSPSRFTADMHHARGFTREIRHLPYFVPEPTPAPRPTGRAAPGERPYFLFAGRLERLKGLQVALDVFRTYAQADLVVAGDGEFEQELRRQAAGLGHVRFLGRVHPDELGALYEHALAVLVPTIGYEVLPFAALEALSHGVPVIAHDRGGQAEAVAVSGAGFTYRTPAELLDAMEQLRTEPTLRSTLGARARAAWAEHWSEEAHLRSYLATIDAVRLRKGSGDD